LTERFIELQGDVLLTDSALLLDTPMLTYAADASSATCMVKISKACMSN
jgi:hypothetical protein